jgi:predicted transport protein
MSDLKLFSIKTGKAVEVNSSIVAKERNIQRLVEENCETLLNVRFLKTEHMFKADDGHNARIDTLGLDENNCPVIIEYKRDGKDTVINQGLFYMDWLVKHPKDFAWLVLEKFGKKIADDIDWTQPRLICIAQDFSRYDEFAIKQMQKNIDLIRYRIYENDHLLFELVNTSSDENTNITHNTSKKESNINKRVKTVTDKLDSSSAEVKDLYKELDDYLLSLGDDIQKKILMHYIAYRRLKNFASVQFYLNKIIIYLNVDPDDIILEKGFTRDMRSLGHYGTGKLEITIKNLTNLEKAKTLIEKSLENS